MKTPDPHDGRQVHIRISALGETTLANERSRRDHWLARHLDELALEDRATLRQAAKIMRGLADT